MSHETTAKLPFVDDEAGTRELVARSVGEETEALHSAYEETVQRLVAASTYRDIETPGHIKRMGMLSEALALATGCDSTEAEKLRLAAPMHDVGKIGIPDCILQKPGRLTTDEFEIMKQHTIIGGEILAGSECAVLRLAQTIALSHHERWDGSGYPSGLVGKEIPLPARIVGIVDVYDALTHDRTYRPAFSEAHAISIMLDGNGSHFDPELLEAFVSELPAMRRLSAQFADAPAGAKFIGRARQYALVAPHA